MAITSALVPAEVSSGQLAITYSVNGDSKVVDVKATDFQPDALFPVRPPRSSHYVYARIEEASAAASSSRRTSSCSAPANPSAEIATVETVARWSNQSGTILGRADSMGTGGQIATGDQWMGVTCG